MPTTLNFYNSNSATFFDDTVGVDMSVIQDRFLALVPKGGFVLDAGCGSGRDAMAFKLRGCRVAAFDASPELAALAGVYIGQEVATRTFADVGEVGLYDGIWACASLLHSDIMSDLDQSPGVSRTLANQQLRSGTSIGANVEEGQGSQSRADFVAKYSIACIEARETHYPKNGSYIHGRHGKTRKIRCLNKNKV